MDKRLLRRKHLTIPELLTDNTLKKIIEQVSADLEDTVNLVVVCEKPNGQVMVYTSSINDSESLGLIERGKYIILEG